MSTDLKKESMATSRISVVIPTFNRAGDIGRCLDSLITQTYGDFEVLVVDDGSTDGTVEVVRRYEDRLNLTYHWQENFGGPARARNLGVGLARGDYVAFLDSDDWWAPKKLQISLDYLERGADLVYHDLYLGVRRGQKFYWRKSSGRALRRPIFEDLIANGNALNNSSVVVKRSLLQAIDGFSEDRKLIAAEDYDAWLRVAKLTDAFVRIPQTLGYYWIGSGNLSNPRRTVTTTEALEERYFDEFRELRRRINIHWPGYLKARSHYLMGSYDEARAQLAAIDWRQTPVSLRAKSLWMSLIIGMRNARARV
jgi:glycosyltransferase involved in cell wall biosynthesis